MTRLSVITAAAILSVLPVKTIAAANPPQRGDVFSILATTGGYYLRTISPRGDQLVATCQLLRKGSWVFTVNMRPVVRSAVSIDAPATLTLAGRWSYPLRNSGAGEFVWAAPDETAFALFLKRAISMGWSDKVVSRELGVDFPNHGTDDPGTIAAFSHLCRLHGVPPAAY